MADMFDKEKRSQIMSKIRSKNTKPELILFEYAKVLWHRGYRYRKHYSKVEGKPDLVFTKEKVAVFVDSEFWHGKNFQEQKERLPKEYWQDKIARNIERDKEVNKKLKSDGWLVKRIWAKRMKKEPESVIEEIKELLESRTSE